MERLTIDEAIEHAKEVAQEKYNEGFLCHANPNDENLDGCIKCAKEHEQLAEWLEELKEYKRLEEQGLLLKLPCKLGDTLYLPVDITNEIVVGICSGFTTDGYGCRGMLVQITYEKK